MATSMRGPCAGPSSRASARSPAANIPTHGPISAGRLYPAAAPVPGQFTQPAPQFYTLPLRPIQSIAAHSADVTSVDSDASTSGQSHKAVPKATVWEIDFCSRPLLDERGKKIWELLICDTDRNFEYSEYFPNSKINSAEVRGGALVTPTPPLEPCLAWGESLVRPLHTQPSAFEYL